jgi:hypothetical protein
MKTDLTISDICDQTASIGDIGVQLAQERLYLKTVRRKQAERERLRTQQKIDEMISGTSEGRIAAAKARAKSVHAKIDERVAEGDLRAAETGASACWPGDVAGLRIDDLQGLFRLRDRLPPWLVERIKKIYAKINWKTRKGQKGYFNVAVNKNGIRIDQTLTTLAHLHGITDDQGRDLELWIESVVECGLFPKIKRHENKQGKKVSFEYGKRCQDGEHCELCNYINVSDGRKELFIAYDEAAFARGGHWFAFTVAPRTNRKLAKAVGRTLTQEDWHQDNPDSAVFRESYNSRVFRYPDPFDTDEGMDWNVGSNIRYFLGAVQYVFGKLVKNDWLDGIRAKVENSVEFLPFKSHQHWHGVGSSNSEHDPQAMAEFIHTEVNAILARTSPGLYADVLVAVISTPEDLQRWIKYITKTVDLVGAVDSVYNRHPDLRRDDEIFREFYQELQLYPKRSRQVFGMIRNGVADERGKHTYELRRRYLRGNHKFGKGSILSESSRHRKYRKREEARMREKRKRQARGNGQDCARRKSK